MAGQRLSMRKSREILRQKYELKHSHRDVARSLGMGVELRGYLFSEPASAAEFERFLEPEKRADQGPD